MCKNVLFAHKVCTKCGFPHFRALFLESAETPLFAQINYLAISTLWLVLKILASGPPTLAFFHFFVFFSFPIFLVFWGAFILSFPRVFGFREERNPSFLPCFPFFRKKKGWRVRERGPGTVRTVVQEPELEPSVSVKTVSN